MTSAQSETGRLTRVLLKRAKDAFVDDTRIDAEWRDLNFTARPDLGRAASEYERFAAIFDTLGVTVHHLPADSNTTLDSIYVRDASFACDRGLILCGMGKPLRASEPDAQVRALDTLGITDIPIAGRIIAPGRVEGGDVFWLDRRSLAIGRGYRTNDEGIRQLRAILGNLVDEMIVVPLPHWRGEGDVMHLMSLISPVDDDLAVVHSRLLPVPFRERLLERGMTLIDVPDDEFESMGTNVLALAPRRCLMLAGNPRTRAGLERAGAEVIEYEGQEISVKGGGGPTCLTRPIARAI